MPTDPDSLIIKFPEGFVKNHPELSQILQNNMLSHRDKVGGIKHYLTTTFLKDLHNALDNDGVLSNDEMKGFLEQTSVLDDYNFGHYDRMIGRICTLTKRMASLQKEFQKNNQIFHAPLLPIYIKAIDGQFSMPYDQLPYLFKNSHMTNHFWDKLRAHPQNMDDIVNIGRLVQTPSSIAPKKKPQYDNGFFITFKQDDPLKKQSFDVYAYTTSPEATTYIAFDDILKNPLGYFDIKVPSGGGTHVYEYKMLKTEHNPPPNELHIMYHDGKNNHYFDMSFGYDETIKTIPRGGNYSGDRAHIKHHPLFYVLTPEMFLASIYFPTEPNKHSFSSYIQRYYMVDHSIWKGLFGHSYRPDEVFGIETTIYPCPVIRVSQNGKIKTFQNDRIMNSLFTKMASKKSFDHHNIDHVRAVMLGKNFGK